MTNWGEGVPGVEALARQVRIDLPGYSETIEELLEADHLMLVYIAAMENPAMIDPGTGNWRHGAQTPGSVAGRSEHQSRVLQNRGALRVTDRNRSIRHCA